MTAPTISIVMPTFNRRDRLARVLRALEGQTYPVDKFEVVVVSDGSTDGTSAFMATLTSPLRITFVEQPNQGPAVARNTGVSHASGELIIFIDDDVVPSPTLVEAHVKRHVAGDIVVIGPMMTPPDFDMQPWVRWEQALLEKAYVEMAAERMPATTRYFYTGNASLARHWILEAGGFDSHFRRAEDVELAYRLKGRFGLRFVFAADAVGWHYAERSFKSWLETPYLYGRNDVVIAREREQGWLVEEIFGEFHSRHPLVRGLTQLCLDRAQLASFAVGALNQCAKVDALSRAAYSGIFNLRHYQGMADELGGRDTFFARVAAASRTVGPPGSSQ
jgi:glycosyltransferase involved in cell wall biosynthesis